MPQGRRKIPFSAKQKKLQLKTKREKKRKQDDYSDDDTKTERKAHPSTSKINQQPCKNPKANSNRYVLQFYRETEAEIQQRKELARQSFQILPAEATEIDIDEYFPEGLGFPKRPPWNYEMNKDEVEAQESQSFQEYVSNLQNTFEWNKLSYFELNLETWRQLWRVLEMSDIILFIVDIRYAALMFPPSLYDYVINKLEKDMILVLNKIDLAPAALVVAWKDYFRTNFPSLHILTFTSFPSYNLHGNIEKTGGMKTSKRRGRLRMAAEGAQKLMETCQNIVGSAVDLESWKNKITEEMMTEYENEELEIGEMVSKPKAETTFHEHLKYRDGVLTIGCIGQPNVGKSSLMNAIMGKKVVSVSRTPGHTKHFQTIFLTPTVKLCDCPGLVFPSVVPKTLQILMGSYPIAQVREPYTTVRFLAERIDLVKLLHIQHPDDDEEWSAVDICDGWAKARGFLTARTGRTDTYRAANHILRMALDGKICLCLRPVGYTSREEYWKNHPDVKEVEWIQACDKRRTESGIENSTAKFLQDDHYDADDDDEDDDENESNSSFSNNESDVDSGAASDED